MPDYKNLYAYLVGEIDKALTHMDNNDLLEWDHVKRILQNALWEAEERVTGGRRKCHNSPVYAKTFIICLQQRHDFFLKIL